MVVSSDARLGKDFLPSALRLVGRIYFLVAAELGLQVLAGGCPEGLMLTFAIRAFPTWSFPLWQLASSRLVRGNLSVVASKRKS